MAATWRVKTWRALQATPARRINIERRLGAKKKDRAWRNRDNMKPYYVEQCFLQYKTERHLLVMTHLRWHNDKGVAKAYDRRHTAQYPNERRLM